MISFKQLRKTFAHESGAIDVLRGISSEIDAGELVAIVGQSGSGKSTLMNILGLLSQPTSGNHYFKGLDMAVLSGGDKSKLRNQSIGFVFQSFNLLASMTAQQNVMLPLYYSGMKTSDAERRAKQVLAEVGLSERLHHKPNQLSGGQKQRVAIARAVVNSPALILADEPTGALDSNTGDEIMSLFSELNQTQQTTIIIVTHDQKIAQQCSRSLVLKDGLFVGQQ